MKAYFLNEPFGTDNLKMEEVPKPEIKDSEVIVRVTKAGLNPHEYFVINGDTVNSLSPMPHIPGTEVIGVAESSGELIRKGDRVVVYHRIFDGTCEFCMEMKEELCLNGGIWGDITNGGYAEYVSVPEKNLFKVPDAIDDDVGASLSVGGLTPLHALNRAGARPGKKLLVYGASGNTGIFALQIGNAIGMDVYAVSRNSEIGKYGALDVYAPGRVPEGLQADVVINSTGSKFWVESMKHVKSGGSLVTFGMLTGSDTTLDLGELHFREIKIVGSTGGNRREMHDIIHLAATRGFRAPVLKRFKFTELHEALNFYEKKEGGRILIEY